MSFKKDFVWGVASSAYQVEGAAFESDKGLNVWDVGCRQSGMIADGHHGEIACDHYHRFKEDIKMMRELKVKNYRFSVNWARLIPDGIGKLSQDGVRFYNELIDELLNNGITPFLTLFHWEYPYALEQRGGWRNDESPRWFEYYAETVSKLFSDRVENFFTINEPQCFVEHGYRGGDKAPFYKLPFEDNLKIAHNVLKANGLAVRALRNNAKRKIKVSFCMTCSGKMPLKKEDTEIARRELYAFNGTLFNANWWSDPVFFGEYPAEHLEKMNVDFKYDKSDMDIIKVELDSYGVNVYSGDYVTTGEDGGVKYIEVEPNIAKSSMEWKVTPECLYYVPKFLYERYKKPIFITENGVALSEWIVDGGVNDDCRIDYVKRHLQSLKRAADDNVHIGGYFYWSFMDNFEWSYGYSKRFGLIHVDYNTMQRTPKKSAYWYGGVMETNGDKL